MYHLCLQKQMGMAACIFAGHLLSGFGRNCVIAMLSRLELSSVLQLGQGHLKLTIEPVASLKERPDLRLNTLTNLSQACSAACMGSTACAGGTPADVLKCTLVRRLDMQQVQRQLGRAAQRPQPLVDGLDPQDVQRQKLYGGYAALFQQVNALLGGSLAVDDDGIHLLAEDD